MSEEIRDDFRRKVTSVGNSWIVLKSKSHPGHVYYFNSLTGDAVWNLSDAEIEKAKCRTKHLEGQPGGKPTKCPEPKDKPPSTLNSFQPSQTLFNEPFVINSVTEQQSSVFNYSNFANGKATLCTNLSQVSGVLQDTHINNPSSVKPVQLISLNNPIATYNLNSTTAIYNPKVWDVPQTQQIFVPPAMAPLANHNPGTVNVSYNNSSQPVTSGLFFNNIENTSQAKQGVFTRETRTFYPRDNYGQRPHRVINKKSGFTNKNDLRQKLVSKKRFNTKQSGFPEGSGTLRTNPRNTEISTHINTTKDEEFDSVDLNNGTMESGGLETQLHETPSKINVMPLKCLAPPDAHPDAWFIIVDLGVLLNEFKFLTILTDSDEKCHLMVPRRVMAELKTYVTCTENIQARRILRFLSHQIEIGYAYMAQEPAKVEDESMAEVILKTCGELSDNKYHLILISDDNEVLTKASSNINMFSTDEIKNLLLNNSNKPTESSGPKKTFLVDELINKIKITVPNNTPVYVSTEPTTQTLESISPVRHTKDVPKKQETDSQKQNIPENKTEERVSMKRTVDAGIQTDFEDINACITNSNAIEQQPQNDVSNIAQNTKEVIITRPETSVLSIPEKKREIKLKRSTSNQAPNLESEKKQFKKWRRRRNTAPLPNEQIPSHNDLNPNQKNCESPRKNTGQVIQTDISFNKEPTCGHIENTILDDSVESRESSVYTDMRNSTAKENITIEETSTSGIISNTESNVDAESYNSISTTNQQPSICNGQSLKKPMYEVDSISMEEYLKMKCDEWISRFIQIMEEVLSQVLQQDPPFSNKAMPPPWTLHEAAQCVAIKFSSHQDIKSAANKLSSMLFNVSDIKGKITMNMTPYQYMQMYSYGVHLLAAIMKVTSCCEDIEIAVESLNKLLHDIRNPNMDGSTNDTFNDTFHDNLSSNAVSLYSDVPDNNDDSSLREQEALHSDIDESKKRKSSEKEPHKPVKFIRNIDIKSSFFKTPRIFKSSTVNSTVEISNSAKAKLQPFEEKRLTNSQAGEIKNLKSLTETSEKATDESTIQPNIVRNFKICPELEAKLKSSYNLNISHDDDEDYNEDYGEYITEEYSSEDENHSLQPNDANSNKTNAIADKSNNHEPINMEVDSLITDENSKKFKYMMCMLLQEIRKALYQVRILCDQCYEELRKPEQSTDLTRELQKMAERAHLHIIRLCRSLESMLEHETNSTESVCNLLKQADINISHVDAGLLHEYRMSVAKCKNHANEFLNSIQNIISGFNS